MVNTLELLDKKDLLKKEAESFINDAQKEERKLIDSEQSRYNEITKEIEQIDNQIREIEKANHRNYKKTNKTSMEKFSLLKAINDVVNNRPLDERSQEVINAGIEEFRKSGQNASGQIVLPIEERATIQATIATAGQENVAEDKLGILEHLRNNLVLIKAGATHLTGLSGSVSIPVYSGSNVF